MKRTLIAFTLLAVSTQARAADFNMRLYKVSAAVLSAGIAADVASSYGKYEAVPLWRSADGRFGAKGAGLRFGVLGAALAGQAGLIRNPGKRKVVTIANFAIGAGLVAVAARNTRQ